MSPTANSTYPAKRVERVTKALCYLAEEEPETTLRDALADLMHYADAHSIDFTDELETARRNYTGELA